MKHLFVSMSEKQNLFVSAFVHKCLMVLNDVEYTTFKMFVAQMSNYLFVISFQLMFYEILPCSLARPYHIPSRATETSQLCCKGIKARPDVFWDLNITLNTSSV